MYIVKEFSALNNGDWFMPVTGQFVNSLCMKFNYHTDGINAVTNVGKLIMLDNWDKVYPVDVSFENVKRKPAPLKPFTFEKFDKRLFRKQIRSVSNVMYTIDSVDANGVNLTCLGDAIGKPCYVSFDSLIGFQCLDPSLQLGVYN